MAYIGQSPSVGAYKLCDAISTSSTATYNLTVGSVATSPETANHCIVSLNGVIQAPGASGGFTISGSTIVFTSSLTSADVIDFILILGDTMSIGTPSDDTVTLAKMASGTDGNLITYDASGNPVAVATGSDGQVLTSAGAGNPCAFEAAGGGKINQVVSTMKTDQFVFTTANTWTDITGMTRAITPSASDSKVLVMMQMYGGQSSGVTPATRIQRDVGGAGYADSIAIGDAAGSRQRSTGGTFYATDTGQSESVTTTFLDSPTTTSAVTYKVQIYQDNTTSTKINSSGGDADSATKHRYVSTLTCMEVLA